MDEPKRKSFLDILRKNLSLADRSAFITRFVYIGECRGSTSDLQKKFRENVKEIKAEYGEDALTGILLVYPRNFIHLVEATEEIIYRHLKGVLGKQSEKLIGRVIPLPANHNIFKLYFIDWHVVQIRNPPWLLDKIETIELDEIQRQIKNCLSKMYLLSEYLLNERDASREKTIDALTTISRVKPYYLPEVTIVEYLLSIKTPVLEDLRNYINKFDAVPSINFYNDRIWPPAHGFIPQMINSN
ncbi:testis-expressed protein 47-like isoform X1 [Nasonia vitripennis]|uniref:BLUF domain-containing protein n=1 Tax=Nasonia vitripennis TaxID=7425 RepID=A0A7M7HCU6_NASVI|nr:testis-expressed protein 47-like isoform X1 [Nasonia vitripennis]XP_008211288.1 testis-expressed protein 47-like isoform X1 [Nasonia vitripennis]XP_008211289.1 testis-expressed protein 47-like isoform X1 [Nasonia vitripennis]XP_032454846.1 testis-expressed protein 47-like isoform X1 [Nasonia vitripennis]